MNGDPGYSARTTRRAVQLLLSESRGPPGALRIDQVVGTPIGSGFGASAASATSGVYAAAAAAGIPRTKREMALCAHRAEIIEQTGLGTVSVIYDSVGAGAIVRSGEPGEAEFITVKVPQDLRIVTTFLAPFDKKDAISSKPMGERINKLGSIALRAFLSDPSLDSLASEGEKFSRNLGLESPELKKLIARAKAAGATHASQNMIGYAIHSLADAERAERVAKVMKEFGPPVRVDTFEVGKHRAGLLRAIRR